MLSFIGANNEVLNIPLEYEAAQGREHDIARVNFSNLKLTKQEFFLLCPLLKRKKDCFFVDNEQVDIVAFHAIPLHVTTSIIDFVIEHFDGMLYHNQIGLFLKNKNNHVEVITNTNVGCMHRKYKKVLKKNQKTQLTATTDLMACLEYYKKYCSIRFSSEVNNNLLELLYQFYSADNSIKIYSIAVDDQIVGYSVILLDDDNRVLYDMLCPWDMSQKEYNLGKWVAIKNIELAYQKKYAYSLCYGRFPYKDEIIQALDGGL